MHESSATPDLARLLRPHIMALAPILILTAVAFIPVFQSGFLDFDDTAYLTENPIVAGPLSWSSLSLLWSRPILNLWHPLTPITLHLAYQVIGLNAAGFHAISLLIHLANVALLYAVIFMLRGSTRRAAMVALLFAAHPLRVESVAWVSQIKDVMSVFFGLLCLVLYVSHARSPSRLKLWASVLCLGISLLYKPLLVTMPAVLMLLDYYPLGRLSFSPRGQGASDPRGPASWRDILLEKAIYAVPVGAVIARVLPSTGYNVAGNGVYIFPLWLRLENVPVSYVRYIGKFFCPFDGLVLNYPMPESWPVWMVAGAVLILAAVTAGVVLLREAGPMLGVGWFWYLITLFTVSGITYIGDYSIADRYTYFPAIGLAIMVAFSIPESCLSGPVISRGVVLGAAAVGLILGATTWRQLSFWRTPTALHLHGLDSYPDDPLDNMCLGVIRYKAGDFKSAEQYLDRCLSVEPKYTYARLNLLIVLRAQGRQDEAVKQGLIVVEQAPLNTDALGKMGQVYMELANPASALAMFDRASKVEPDSAVWQVMRAGALTQLNRDAEAADALGQALDLDPENGPAHFNLGLLLSRHGQSADAIEHFNAALKKSPGEPHIEAALGSELYRNRQFELSLAHLRSALEHDPDNVAVGMNVASAMTQLGNLAGAENLLKKIVNRLPQNAPAHDSLGVLYSRTGRMDQAISQLRAAEACDPGNPARKRLLDQWTRPGPSTAPAR